MNATAVMIDLDLDTPRARGQFDCDGSFNAVMKDKGFLNELLFRHLVLFPSLVESSCVQGPNDNHRKHRRFL